ncbi:TolC family protein [Roseibacillus persicicus]|uniref:TolC family protein n=1 Tax=Roseibacillus persicicus TaxID=454148 RepID=UPI00280DDB79|nr:TolC family protein [Roseibacillus persicicus]MDQ8190229.1 TolC family protein [Roseibacillus persicicus]
MKASTIQLFCYLLLCLSLNASERSLSGLIVGLDTIPRRISAQNPSLAAARWQIAEAEARLRGSGLRDNPELEAGFQHNSTLREGSIEVGISQRFPVTNRLALEKRVSTTLVQQARAEVQEVERSLIVEARNLLIEIITLRQQQALRAQQAEVSQALAKFISDAAGRAELSSLDAAQAKLNAAKLRTEIPSLKATEIAATGKLKPLLGMKPTDQLHIAGQELPPLSLTENSLILSNRPDFQASQLASQAAREQIDLEISRRYDDIELGMVAGLERAEDAPEGFETEGIVGVRVRLALPFWQKNEAAIQEAQARAERKKLESVSLAETIKNQARAAYEEMIEWAALLENLDKTLLTQASQLATDSEKAYREGLGDLQATLQTREQQLELAETRIETLKQFHLSRVRYEAATGTSSY